MADRRRSIFNVGEIFVSSLLRTLVCIFLSPSLSLSSFSLFSFLFRQRFLRTTTKNEERRTKKESWWDYRSKSSLVRRSNDGRGTGRGSTRPVEELPIQEFPLESFLIENVIRISTAARFDDPLESSSTFTVSVGPSSFLFFSIDVRLSFRQQPRCCSWMILQEFFLHFLPSCSILYPISRINWRGSWNFEETMTSERRRVTKMTLLDK